MTRWLAFLLMVLVGCSSLPPADTSPTAISSGDLSLIETGCSPIPAKGMDICRFHNGSPVTSLWTLYVPWGADAVSGEARIKFGDKVKTYPIIDFQVLIPWTDIVGTTWNKAGLVQALVTVKTKTKVIQALGYAFIVILKEGYDPQPTSSNTSILFKTCDIEYTSAGRSRVTCLTP